MECLPSANGTKEVADIIAALRKHIRETPSANVDSKIATFRIIRGDVQKFAKEMESLADSFRRILIVEMLILKMLILKNAQRTLLINKGPAVWTT